jgi:hypothetical protein
MAAEVREVSLQRRGKPRSPATMLAAADTIPSQEAPL